MSLQLHSDATTDPRLIALIHLYDQKTLAFMTATEADLLVEYSLIVSVLFGCRYGDLNTRFLINELAYIITNSQVLRASIVEYATLKQTCAEQISRILLDAFNLWVADSTLPFCPALSIYSRRTHPDTKDLPYTQPIVGATNTQPSGVKSQPQTATPPSSTKSYYSPQASIHSPQNTIPASASKAAAPRAPSPPVGYGFNFPDVAEYYPSNSSHVSKERSAGSERKLLSFVQSPKLLPPSLMEIKAAVSAKKRTTGPRIVVSHELSPAKGKRLNEDANTELPPAKKARLEPIKDKVDSDTEELESGAEEEEH